MSTRIDRSAPWLASLALATAGLSASVGTASTPHLGFDLTSDGGQVVVTTVYPETPAELMGIAAGDVIVKVDHARATMDSLRRVFTRKRIGSDMHLTFARGNDVQDIDVRIIDKDDPDSWPAATQAVRDKVEQEFRKAMQAFVAAHGPVRVLGVEAVGDGDDRRISVRIANASEHFLEGCDLEVSLVDSAGQKIRGAEQEEPIAFHLTRDVPPANADGTRGIVALESTRPVLIGMATSAVVTIKNVRQMGTLSPATAEPQKVPVALPRQAK